jgi:hypothetical protein
MTKISNVQKFIDLLNEINKTMPIESVSLTVFSAGSSGNMTIWFQSSGVRTIDFDSMRLLGNRVRLELRVLRAIHADGLPAVAWIQTFNTLLNVQNMTFTFAQLNSFASGNILPFKFRVDFN